MDGAQRFVMKRSWVDTVRLAQYGQDLLISISKASRRLGMELYAIHASLDVQDMIDRALHARMS
jgi:hypothetical protein